MGIDQGHTELAENLRMFWCPCITFQWNNVPPVWWFRGWYLFEADHLLDTQPISLRVKRSRYDQRAWLGTHMAAVKLPVPCAPVKTVDLATGFAPDYSVSWFQHAGICSRVPYVLWRVNGVDGEKRSLLHRSPWSLPDHRESSESG